MLKLRQREQIVELSRQGVSMRKIALRLGIGRETVRRWLHDPPRRLVPALPQRARRRSALDDDPELIEARRRVEQKRLELEEREVDASIEEFLREEERERNRWLLQWYRTLGPGREGLA